MGHVGLHYCFAPMCFCRSNIHNAQGEPGWHNNVLYRIRSPVEVVFMTFMILVMIVMFSISTYGNVSGHVKYLSLTKKTIHLMHHIYI